MKFILCCLFFPTCVPCFSQASLDSIFKKANITGVQIVATSNDKITTHYFGNPKAGEATAVTGATIFQAASLSKAVLAYIVLRLADRKLIALDTPLYHYYKYQRINADTAAQRITARMVLHHVTGFPNWAANPLSKEWATSALSTNKPPGSSWSYSGEGFMYLQLAVENILKESLEKIAVREVFVPLKMLSSSFVWKPAFEHTAAYGHNKNGETTTREEFFLPGAAYSLLTTAADYNRFLQALITGKGLNATTHELMFSDTVSVKKSDTAAGESLSHIAWALGLGIQRNELGTAIWHWGDNGDFKGFFMAFPALHKSLVFFSNSNNGLDVMPDVLNYYFGKSTWWAIQWLDKDF